MASSPRFESPETNLAKSSNFNSTLIKKSANPYFLMINSKLANNQSNVGLSGGKTQRLIQLNNTSVPPSMGTSPEKQITFTQ